MPVWLHLLRHPGAMHASRQSDYSSKESKMKTSDKFKLVGLSLLLGVALSACDKPGPAERAGKSMDKTANEAVTKINETADKASVSLSNQSEKTGVALNDAEITAKVKAAVLAEPGLKSLQISVDTIKGVVTLSGSADTQVNSDRTKALASAVSGVVKVDNQLLIKPLK
jgi:hyperosmotically inducible protein